jgi:hypothetical protein
MALLHRLRRDSFAALLATEFGRGALRSRPLREYETARGETVRVEAIGLQAAHARPDHSAVGERIARDPTVGKRLDRCRSAAASTAAALVAASARRNPHRGMPQASRSGLEIERHSSTTR